MRPWHSNSGPQHRLSLLCCFAHAPCLHFRSEQTVAYPLDTVRRVLQVQDSVHAASVSGERYSGMMDALVRLVRRDGVMVLYSGLWANYLKVVPSVGISFVVFEAVKDQLQERFPTRQYAE